MKKSVTVQDIANSLNLSRNTVSKALNGKPVPIKTRNAVINAAIEMGYKSYQVAAATDTSLKQKRFAIISSRLLMSITYHSYILKGIEDSLSEYDIELVQFRITDDTSFNKFKRYLTEFGVDGIICIEFFNSDYISEILEMGQAFVFMDFPLTGGMPKGKYDIILPESINTVKNFCTQLIESKGCKTFGYVGDYKRCFSFYERFLGMREALFLSDLPVDMKYSVTYNDSMSYDTASITEKLKKMDKLPDCFVAANDFIAVNLLSALNKLGKNVPDDIKIVGFDNTPEAKKTNPPLTSISVNKTAIGRRMVSLLFERVANPTLINQIVYISSKVVVRAST
ncbi:MAG: LacI family DNA-binding transcriptional regulator [Ruminiclostridium sp.]|nr:LacI family DNA-binding transcriptional regulator [Ruminiclostridium sp.]